MSSIKKKTTTSEFAAVVEAAGARGVVTRVLNKQVGAGATFAKLEASSVADAVLAELHECKVATDYRLLCSVQVMEDKGQGVQSSAACRWSQPTDGSFALTVRNGSTIVLVTVFGVK